MVPRWPRRRRSRRSAPRSGELAREVSAASLLAFTLLLPIVFLALVPSGVVSEALYDITRVVSALFPFEPALDAISSALYGEGDLVGPAGSFGRLAAAFTSPPPA